MPRVAKELSALEVKRLAHPSGHGRPVTFAVGGVAGLLLQITPNGGRTWILRTRVGAKRREIGLGGASFTLAQARERARDALAMIRDGIDPVEDRKAKRAALVVAQKRGLTFADAMDTYCAAKMSEFRSERHRQIWRSSMALHVIPALGGMLVSDIDRQDILRVLTPLWQDKTETARRLRGRIEAVLSWATVNGHRTGDNPAKWKGNLSADLSTPSKVAGRQNHPAVMLDDAASWFADVRSRSGSATRALEFLALTASRSGEVRGAAWEEIDLDKALWIVPASRMKMAREHRVPLTPEAVALLKALPRFEDNPLVFPAPRGGMLSDAGISACMKRINEAREGGYIDRVNKRPAVPHGLRSTFRDWAAERTEYPRDMAEIALAHQVGSEVERAYRRGDMIEKRRGMMAAWGRFLRGDAGAKVVPIKGRG
jgi:integrase